MKPDFKKNKSELLPVIIQDYNTSKVLMLGYMNSEAFEKTKKEKRVTFYSRSKNRLWTKGETSGNFLELREILLDCDADTIFIKVEPKGVVCHTGADTCFNETNINSNFLLYLEAVINKRKIEPVQGSYTNKLFDKGINRIAQKVGEEAIELVIEAKDDNKDLFLGEAADLMYHYLVLLVQKGYLLNEVIKTLEGRHK